MLWVSAVLIAAVSNLDNLAVGLALGVRARTIAAAPNVVIAAVTMAGTAGAMTSSRALSRVLSPSLASALGSSIIIAIGAWTVVASLRAMRSGELRSARHRHDRDAHDDELGENKVVSCREALTLGIALALNNAGAGVGAGIAGVSPIATTLLAGALSLTFVAAGSRLGSALGTLVVGRRAPVFSGCVLVCVGSLLLSGAA
jgi:putative sporulation protein YtaF